MILGRYQASLEQARNGAYALVGLRDSLLELPDSEKWVSASGADLQSVANWSAATILRNVLRDLKPTSIVDAPAGQNMSSFDHEAIAPPVLVWRLLDVRDRKPGGNDGIASSDRV